MKKCKYCAEEVKDEAKVCKHCGMVIKGFDTSFHGIIGKPVGCIVFLFIILSFGVFISYLVMSYVGWYVGR